MEHHYCHHYHYHDLLFVLLVLLSYDQAPPRFLPIDSRKSCMPTMTPMSRPNMPNSAAGGGGGGAVGGKEDESDANETRDLSETAGDV